MLSHTEQNMFNDGIWTASFPNQTGNFSPRNFSDKETNWPIPSRQLFINTRNPPYLRYWYMRFGPICRIEDKGKFQTQFNFILI